MQAAAPVLWWDKEKRCEGADFVGNPPTTFRVVGDGDGWHAAKTVQS